MHKQNDDSAREVEVCSRCLRASCWHGEFYCDEWQIAGTATRTVAQLDALNRESPHHYAPEKIRDVYGLSAEDDP